MSNNHINAVLTTGKPPPVQPKVDPSSSPYAIDNAPSYDPEDMNAQITKERYEDYIQRFVPILQQQADMLTSDSYVTDLADKTQQLGARGMQIASNTVNAQRGRMGMAVNSNSPGDQARKALQSVGGYNQGKRGAEQIQQQVLGG